MAEKQIVLPLMSKHLVLEALLNYERLLNRRYEAERFETVKRELAKSRDEVVTVRKLVETQ